MDEEIAALEQTNMWDLLPFSYMFVRSHISGSIKLRPALIVLLIAIRLVLLFVIFSRNMVMIMMRHFLLLLIGLLFTLFLSLLLFRSGPSLNLI
jgi:hypothetical protein